MCGSFDILWMNNQKIFIEIMRFDLIVYLVVICDIYKP
jgi:hypothetical protein